MINTMIPEPAAIAIHMKALTGSEGWPCYRDLLLNMIEEDLEKLVLSESNIARGRIQALRDAVLLPDKWIEWRKKQNA